jgi:PAS domain-containing protein
MMKKDQTEERAAQRALRESEEQYRVLFQSSRDAIMTLAPPAWSFTSGNPATVELFGAKDHDRDSQRSAR